MRLECVVCHRLGADPFVDAAPYGRGQGRALCVTHGPTLMPPLTVFAREPIKDFRLADTFVELPSRRFVGMEFEMYHQRHDTDRVAALVRDWRLLNCGVGEDGSIRSPANCEVKTPPAQGDDAVLWARAVCQVALSYGMRVGEDCGLHVHVDMRDHTVMALRRLAVAIVAFEPVIYASLPPQRAAVGRYSRPTEASVDRIRKAPRDASFYRAWFNGRAGRYYGCNLLALTEHGTVEFRYHAGTLNKEKVLHWLRVCTAFVDWARDGGTRMPTGLSRFSSFEARVLGMADTLALPQATVAYLQNRYAPISETPTEPMPTEAGEVLPVPTEPRAGRTLPRDSFAPVVIFPGDVSAYRPRWSLARCRGWLVASEASLQSEIQQEANRCVRRRLDLTAPPLVRDRSGGGGGAQM